ncbi:hypothetical protein Tco_1234076 [Tanacetum coccineum]
MCILHLSTHNASYQLDDFDAYDSNYDEISTTTAVLMANLSSYGSYVLSEVVQIVLWYLDSGCSKHITGDRSQLTNFVHKFLGTAKFGNEQVAKIMGYEDYQIRNVTISSVYYVEGLGHNLFSVGQLCDSYLEVASRKHTCFVHNLEGVDLLSGSRGTNLYSLSIKDMMASFLYEPPSPDFVPEPAYPEFMPHEDDVFPAEEQPLPAALSPTADSLGYITESDPEEDPDKEEDEDPEEDPTDYPTHVDDYKEEEESS